MLIKTRELGFFLLRFLLGAVLLFCLPIVSAIRVPVKHIEGVSHGFIVLHAQDGRALATGDMIQTVEGERVTNEVVLHFKDGSVHDEVTVFSQNHEFRCSQDQGSMEVDDERLTFARQRFTHTASVNHNL